MCGAKECQAVWKVPDQGSVQDWLLLSVHEKVRELW